jgi:cell division protein FtsB
MRKSRSRATRIWIAVFAGWGLLLTGAFSQWVGSPGVLQAVRLSNLLQSKQVQAESLEKQIATLEAERVRLEKSPAAQEQEIRRTLGYAAPDEIIFDFTAAERSGHGSGLK